MTDAQAWAGEGLPPKNPKNTEVKAAMSDLLAELKTFKNQIQTKLKQQEEHLNMLKQKTITYGRPALSASAEQEIPHQKAFNAYLRFGDDDALRGLNLEGKAMNTSVNADGGYLVDPQTSEMIGSILYGKASLRSVASVVTVQASSYDVIVDRSDLGSGWSSETSALTETATPTFERISIPLNELSAMPKVSQRLLDDSAFEIETWLAQKIADKFGRAEAESFISGDGNNKPMGFLSYDKVADENWTWGKIGYVPTGVDGDFSSTNPADVIVDLVYAVGAAYRANAVFVMNSKTTGAIRKMKDADGRFLWNDGLANGEPPRLMGYPVLVCEDMPDIASGSYALAFGDFAAGYTIAERPDLRILRDPFSAKPNVLFYAHKRVGGDVSDFEAIKLLKFATT